MPHPGVLQCQKMGSGFPWRRSLQHVGQNKNPCPLELAISHGNRRGIRAQTFRDHPEVDSCGPKKIPIRHGLSLKVSVSMGKNQPRVVTECVELQVLRTLVVLFCQNESTRPCRPSATAAPISKVSGKTKPSLLGP